MVSNLNTNASNDPFGLHGSSLAQDHPVLLRTILDLADRNGLEAFRRQVSILGQLFDWEIGWWYGALVSDGWVQKNTVGYTKEDDVKRNTFVAIARKMAVDEISVREYTDKGDKGNKLGSSIKVHLNNADFARSVYSCYQPPRDEEEAALRGALRKIIPREILNSGSRECLFGRPGWSARRRWNIDVESCDR